MLDKKARWNRVLRVVVIVVLVASIVTHAMDSPLELFGYIAGVSMGFLLFGGTIFTRVKK